MTFLRHYRIIEAWSRRSLPGALEGGSHMRLNLEAGNASGEARSQEAVPVKLFPLGEVWGRQF